MRNQIQAKDALSQDEAQTARACRGSWRAKTRQHSELKSQVSAQMAKVEEAQLRKERIHHEVEELNRQLATRSRRIPQGPAPGCKTALDSMEQDVGGRELLRGAARRAPAEH